MEGLKDGLPIAAVMAEMGKDELGAKLGCSGNTIWRAVKEGKQVTVFKDRKGWRAVEAKPFPDKRYVR